MARLKKVKCLIHCALLGGGFVVAGGGGGAGPWKVRLKIIFKTLVFSDNTQMRFQDFCSLVFTVD